MPDTTPGTALGAEISTFREFVDLLQREQMLLQAANTEGLIPLADVKARLADRLGEHSHTRITVLERLGYPGDRTGMSRWLAEGGTPTDQNAWQTLQALAREAKSLNELNGKLIGLHMSRTQQAFTALMNASERAMTYGPNGHAQAGLGRRIIGKA